MKYDFGLLWNMYYRKKRLLVNIHSFCEDLHIENAGYMVRFQEVK